MSNAPEVQHNFSEAIDDLIGRRGGRNRLRLSAFRSEALAMAPVKKRLAENYSRFDNPKTLRSLPAIARGKSTMRRAPSGMPKGANAEWTNEERFSYRKGTSRDPRYRVGLITKKGGKRDDPTNPWTWTFLEYGTKFQPARSVLRNTFRSMRSVIMSRFSGGMKHYIGEAIRDLEARAKRAEARAARRAARGG